MSNQTARCPEGYAPLSNKMWCHLKFEALERYSPTVEAKAVMLWTKCLSYSSGHLTDGRIVAGVVRKMCRGRIEQKAIDALVGVGLWEVVEDGQEWQIHDYHQRNNTKSFVRSKVSDAGSETDSEPIEDESDSNRDQIENGLRSNRDRNETKSRSNPTSTPLKIIEEKTPSFKQEARSNTNLINLPDSASAEVRRLESELGDDFVSELRSACALSRQRGTMSDSVWAKTMTQLAKHSPDAVRECGQRFIERYADGEKNERYLLGMVRRQKQRGSATEAFADARPRSAFTPEAEEQSEREFEALMMGVA